MHLINGHQMEGLTINNIHDEALIEHFSKAIGKKVFILMGSFPLMFIGEIDEVIDDMVVIDVETTSVAPLENRKWHIHIHSIELFYIEKLNGPKLPKLKD